MRDIRTKYQAHVSAMLKLAGFADTDARAERIVALEHAIAEKHLSLAENEDIHKANNTWTQADFAAKAPGLDWAEYFRGAGLSKQASFTVWQPTAFVGESALVASTPLDTWKDWLAYHLIEEYAAVLPKALADERYAFFGKELQGAPEQRPRWQRGVVIVNSVPRRRRGKNLRAALLLSGSQGRRRRPWWPTSLRLSASASTRSRGWRLLPKPKPRPS